MGKVYTLCRPVFRPKRRKTLPDGAAHTCTVYIKEYPPGSKQNKTKSAKSQKKLSKETKNSTIKKSKVNLVFGPLRKKYMDLLDFMQIARLATASRPHEFLSERGEVTMPRHLAMSPLLMNAFI